MMVERSSSIVRLTAEQIALLIEILEEFHPYGMTVEMEEKDKDEILQVLGAMAEELI